MVKARSIKSKELERKYNDLAIVICCSIATFVAALLIVTTIFWTIKKIENKVINYHSFAPVH